MAKQTKAIDGGQSRVSAFGAPAPDLSPVWRDDHARYGMR
jgi:hypothetical protein